MAAAAVDEPVPAEEHQPFNSPVAVAPSAENVASAADVNAALVSTDAIIDAGTASAVTLPAIAGADFQMDAGSSWGARQHGLPTMGLSPGFLMATTPSQHPSSYP